jgi:hypothetical protein
VSYVALRSCILTTHVHLRARELAVTAVDKLLVKWFEVSKLHRVYASFYLKYRLCAGSLEPRTPLDRFARVLEAVDIYEDTWRSTSTGGRIFRVTRWSFWAKVDTAIPIKDKNSGSCC